MTFDFHNAQPKQNRLMTAQRVLRGMSIVVGVLGIGFLAWRWMNPPQPRAPQAPADAAAAKRSSDNETDYDIDLRNYPLPVRPDNGTAAEVPPTPPPVENETAAIVGLDDVKDGALIEQQPLYYLLREVENKRPADDFFMKRVALVPLSELRDKPQDFRGKPVAVRGSIIRIERSSLPANPSGVRYVLEGEMFVPEQGMCMFITSRLVPVFPGQTVEFRGLFMKLMTYQAKGGSMEQAPLIVASHPIVVRGGAGADQPSSSGGGPAMLVGILVILFVIFIALQFAMRRKGAGGNRAVEARRKAREMLGRTGLTDDDLPPPVAPPGENP